jgi:signal transduction histidine kinase
MTHLLFDRPTDHTTNPLNTSVILIVDDTPTNLEVLFETLSEAGFEVSVATGGESALKQVEHALPDLILLDVMMPGMDGFETCQHLQLNPLTKDVPVIFMTALADSVDKVRGLSLGAVDYITKPFQQEEVLARIQIHLKLRNLSKMLTEQNLQLRQEVEKRKVVESDLQKLTQVLEQKVDERTTELTQALHQLKQAQAQLVQDEKLATLGQLVAGVAHEINNPINFIHGNIAHIKQYAQDLLEFLQLCQTQFSQPNPAIQQKAKEIDLEFLLKDLPKILSSMQIGTERIREIVQSLRVFSRHDEAEVKEVNIHDGIDSTLLILNSRLKGMYNLPAIEIIKEYGELPPVECYAGQLNQVFMNVIGNAIDALEEMTELSPSSLPQTPIIRIRTACVTTPSDTSSDRVAIWINDNGPGISEEILQRIFDPFFTTKPAGKGTGLGMSISHQIIAEKHKGKIQCLSTPGEGTSFMIEIPIQQANRS